MASFARSFKAPSFLAAHGRPGMPGRTTSSSSEMSLTSENSGRSDDDGEPAASAPGTPGVPVVDDGTSCEAKDGPDDASASASASASATTSPWSCRSRPIAIQLPKIKKINSGSVCTPPEPLSARGDLPGGYFPMHEDPKARVHRPHPFHHDAGLARHSLAKDSHTMHPDRLTPHAAATSSAAPSAATSNTPVTSYLPSGYHDAPLPLGKYYPSNYEQHQRQRNSAQKALRPSMTDTLPSSIKSDSQVPKYAPSSPHTLPYDAEARHKMQQYQRDMVAQASQALRGSSSKASPKPGNGLPLKGLPNKDGWFNGPMPRRPISPRLLPLGSPGPVTPMELESTGGGYLDKGRSQDRRLREGNEPPGAGFTAHSM